MKINSPAGKFMITFEAMEPVDEAIQITGKFGHWDAKAEMSYAEFWGLVRMALSVRMVWNMLRSMFRRSPGSAS